MVHTVVVTTIPAQKETDMIELTNVNGQTVSFNANSISAIRIADLGTYIDIGAETYLVKESYEEVIIKIRGKVLETK